MIQTVLLFIVSLLVVVVVHELGHFLTSKRVGLPVEEFGIGFPPRLYGRMWRGTVYSINALPVGAFVRTLGENDPRVAGSLAAAPAWHRFLVYLAGPLANIILAFLLFTSFFALPRAVSVSDGLLVCGVDEGSPAEVAGLQPGDIILTAEGAVLERGDDLRQVLAMTPEPEAISITFSRQGAELASSVVPEYSEQLGRKAIGIILGSNIVTAVEPSSLADTAGIQAGDSLLGVNGFAAVSQSALNETFGSAVAGDTLVVTMLRDKSTYTIEFEGAEVAREPLGLELGWVPGSRIEKRGVSFSSAALMSSRYILSMPALIVASVPLMREDPSLAFVGPIGAGQLTVEAVEVFGLSNLIFIGGLISIGIALFNLIPVPPLDGGGILVALIEAVRRGKRLSERSVRLAYAVGTSLLITLVVFITTSDLLRLIQGRGFGL